MTTDGVRRRPKGEHLTLGEAQAWALDALDSLTDGVVIVDDQLRVVYKNDAAARLFGMEFLGGDRSDWQGTLGVFRPDGVMPFPVDEFTAVRALAGEPTPEEEQFIRNPRVPNGVHMIVSSSPLHDDAGRVRGVVTIFHDITQRRKNENRILEGERQKKAILDNIPDIAWLKDREGRYVAVNQTFVEAAGRTSADEVVGLTDLDLWSREIAEAYRAGDDACIESGRQLRIEETFVDARGKSYFIETIKTCIVGDRGEIIGTTGIAHDMTDRKRAEEALRGANDELERRVADRSAELAEAQENLVRKERLAVLGQLAGGVAHQIRNPLAAIMNASYVLKRHLSPEQHPNVEDAIRIIHDEVRHANVIITSLLDHARVRAPDRHPASIVEILEKVLASDFVPKSVRIERAIEVVPLLDVDSDQLHGALFNVVRNAVEAMPGGGVLRVEVGVDGDQLVVAISDTGPGISPQVRAHLFEPLHSTKPLGIGLGLVTARTLVEAHGGRIACVDVPTGARFEIRLPIV